MGRIRQITAFSALAALFAVLAVVSGAAAGEPFEHDSRGLEVVGEGRMDVTGLMPGDSIATQVVRVTASGCLEISLRARYDGSDALAGALHVTVTDPRTRTRLFTGALRDASDASPVGVLCDESVELQIDAQLDLAAGNEVQGQTLRAEWVVVAVEVLPGS